MLSVGPGPPEPIIQTYVMAPGESNRLDMAASGFRRVDLAGIQAVRWLRWDLASDDHAER